MARPNKRVSGRPRSRLPKEGWCLSSWSRNCAVLYGLDLKAATGHKLHQAASVLRNFASAFKMKVGDIEIGVGQSRGEGDSGNLEQDLPDLLVAVCDAQRSARWP